MVAGIITPFYLSWLTRSLAQAVHHSVSQKTPNKTTQTLDNNHGGLIIVRFQTG